MNARLATSPALRTPALPSGGQMAVRMLVGARLRRLREAAGIDREEAGYAICASASKISRMELGRVGLKQRDVSDLLVLYGVRDEDFLRHQLLELVAQSTRPGWWHDYSDVVPAWFEPYLGLEHAAAQVRQYQVQFVPDLLQTEEYTRAVERLRRPDAPEGELDRRVALLEQRQRLMTRDASPKLWAVVDEAVLRRPLGGDSAMRKQIEALIVACDQPHVTIQVIPFKAGGHAVAGGAFTFLRFSEPDLPEVVYLEQLDTALYLDNRASVEPYLAVMDRLCLDAEPASATQDILARLLPDFGGGHRRESVSRVRTSPVGRRGHDDRVAADIYRQARDHATHSLGLTYDVEKGLRRLQARLENDDGSDSQD